MKRPLPAPFRRLAAALRRRKGSVLLIVLMVAVALASVSAPMMNATIQDTVANEGFFARLQSRDAAEAILDYGVADLKTRWDNNASFPSNELVTHPLSLPSNYTAVLWGNTSVNPTSAVITGGIIPGAQQIYIDPNNPAYQFDPQRGKIVLARDVMIYAKVTATTPLGKPITAYAAQALEVRDGSLFSHAIFYNMDLEFHPGPAMTISGPVHSNGNIWAVAQTGVTFSSTITTAGTFNVGMKPWPTDWSSQSGELGTTVYIPNGGSGSNTTATPYKGSGGTQVATSYYDSRQTNFNGTGYTNWRDFAANKWNGYLQTGANGVPSENIIGYNNYVMDPYGNGTNQDLNYAYAVIGPNQFNPSSNQYSDALPSGSLQTGGEEDKYARKASIIMRVYDGPSLPSNSPVTITNVTTGSTLPANVTATVYHNNMVVFTYTGNASNTTLVNSYIDSAVGNFTTVANSGNSSTVTADPIANATLPPSTDPNFSFTRQKPFMLTTQTKNKTSSGTSETYALNNAAGSKDMQWTTGNGTAAKTNRIVGYAWTSLSTLQATVDSTGVRTQVYNGTTQLTDSYGNVIYPGDVIEQPIAVNAAMITGNIAGGNMTGNLTDMFKIRPAVGNMTGITPSATMGNMTSGGGSSNTTNNGMWNGLADGRRADDTGAQTGTASELRTMDIDLGKLRYVLDDSVPAYNGTKAQFYQSPDGGATPAFNPNDYYNGIIYVEFPMSAPNASRLANITAGNTTYPGDKIVDSQDGWGLVLNDASVVPNPTYNNTTVRGPGFTLATNNALYVQGNYNADGNMNTPATDSTANAVLNSTMPDSSANPNPPCALAADSITVLSTSWLNTLSSEALANRNAGSTEVCAAMLTGIVPSMKSSSTQISGGAHNFPRFLENWSGDVFRYRGSLVCLFESEIGRQPLSTNYYSPPNREWGFYNLFAQGVYPPGTPSERSYRRTNFQFLTLPQYNAAIALIH